MSDDLTAYHEQHIKLLEGENQRLLEDLSRLRAEILRIQEEAHKRIKAAQAETHSERIRAAQTAAEERARARVVYRIPDDLQAALDARYALEASWRYVVLGDGDQIDAETAFRRQQAWTSSVTRILKPTN